MTIQKTVLVVDDEEDVVRYLETMLQDAGFTVMKAFNADEALERLKERKPDMISLDIVMPKGSGIKFHRALKKNPAWSEIPVMVVTGHARDELGKADFKEMTLSGKGVYLEKPVNPVNYISAVRKILGMETQPAPEGQSGLREELKNLLDTADIETLDKIKALMGKKGE